MNKSGEDVGVNPQCSAQSDWSRRHQLPMRDFSKSLPMALLNAREKIMEEFRPMLRKFGLTEQQWRVIRVLGEVSSIEVTELATRCRVLPPSLSRILQNLESRALISRRVSRVDQRRIAIRLSAKGRRLFKRVAPNSEVLYASITASLGPRKLQNLFALLEELGGGTNDTHETEDA